MREKVHVDKQKETPVKLICIICFVVLFVVAAFTAPDEKTMQECLRSEVRQAIADVKSGEGDSTIVSQKEMERMFDYFNLTEYHNYRIFSVINITDRVTTEKSTAIVGLFGTTITLADWPKYVIIDRPMPKGKTTTGSSTISTEPIYTGHDYNVGTYHEEDY